MHPIQRAIESLYAKERCPRLRIDVTHEGVVCPDFVRERWQQQLVIDLDPSYPLDLAYTKLGVEADLSFGGYVTRCVFPWTAIYMVADRETGQGQVFPEHIPAALRQGPAPKPKPGPRLAVEPAADGAGEVGEAGEAGEIDEPTVRVEDIDARGPRRRRRRRPGREDAAEAEDATKVGGEGRGLEGANEAGEAGGGGEAEQLGDAVAEEVVAEEVVAVEDAAPSASEQQAKSRRAAFKVIDGGD